MKAEEVKEESKVKASKKTRKPRKTRVRKRKEEPIKVHTFKNLQDLKHNSLPEKLWQENRSFWDKVVQETEKCVKDGIGDEKTCFEAAKSWCVAEHGNPPLSKPNYTIEDD